MNPACDWCGDAMPIRANQEATRKSVLICPSCRDDLHQALSRNGLRPHVASDGPTPNVQR